MSTLGKYALIRKLAEGGMAELFLASEKVPGGRRVVVVKRILPELAKDANFVKMFQNEGRVAAQLHHANIVRIFEVGEMGEDQPFIAMEFIHGEDLRELQKTAAAQGAQLPLPLVCRAISDMLAGLHYAHTLTGEGGKPLGLVHRDVSPQNVLVTYEGQVKLLDFGIAKATRAQGEQTQAGTFKGKFAYMSPEQARSQQIDARTDVFAAGILLWELLTGQRLFKRDTELATLVAVTDARIVAPSTHAPRLPLALDRIALRALARSATDRYPSALHMRNELEQVIRDQRWEADPRAVQRMMRELFPDKVQAVEAELAAAGARTVEELLLADSRPARAPSTDRQTARQLPGVPVSAPVYDDVSTDPYRAGVGDDEGEDLAEAATMYDANLIGSKRPSAPAPAHDQPNATMSLRAGKRSALPTAGGPAPKVPTPTPPAQLSTVLMPEPLPASDAMSTLERPAPPAPGAASRPAAGGWTDPASRLSSQAVTSQAPEAALAAGYGPAVAVAQPEARTLRGQDSLQDYLAPPYGAAPVAFGAQANTAPVLITSTRGGGLGRRVVVIGAAAILSAGLGLLALFWPPRPIGPDGSAPAVLVISTDEPAAITVDDVAEPPGTSATVDVKAGVAHRVTVTRTGAPPKVVLVPPLSPGERLPIEVTLTP